MVGSEESFRTLLQSVVEVARAIFGAKASSIFLLDEEADELVFEAVAGEGAETLVGQRFPSSTGVAGWVLVTRQSLVIEDVSQDPRFSKDVAESTGYVPKGLMAVPAAPRRAGAGRARGARPAGSGASSRSSRWICSGSSRTRRRSRSTSYVEPGGPRRFSPRAGRGSDVVARLAATVDGLQDEQREAGLKLLGALEEVLRRNEGGY